MMNKKALTEWHIETLLSLLEWVQEHGDFECSCKFGPEYERDTGATIHDDECAVEQEGQLEWWLDWLAKGE